ncbi:hypothetical protein XH92_23610 [Bradyrhizobium sp. CCBAU 53421]|nr:hypothetical protein XH92_23610 [Bradyrhizobium sp. CCBAU 53421]
MEPLVQSIFKGGIMRTLLLVGVIGFSAAFGSLVEGAAHAQSAKAKPKPQAAGQMLCTAGGCRPVKPGCRIESHKNVGQVEVCSGGDPRPSF